ncbi:MAG: hypothetical protein ACI392_01995 [Paludibacteraceae bacterium]
MKPNKQPEMAHLHSLSDLHRCKRQLRQQIDVQELRLTNDVRHIRRSLHTASHIIDNIGSALSYIAPSAGFVGLGIGLVRLLLKRRKKI